MSQDSEKYNFPTITFDMFEGETGEISRRINEGYESGEEIRSSSSVIVSFGDKGEVIFEFEYPETLNRNQVYRDLSRYCLIFWIGHGKYQLTDPGHRVMGIPYRG